MLKNYFSISPGHYYYGFISSRRLSLSLHGKQHLRGFQKYYKNTMYWFSYGKVKVFIIRILHTTLMCFYLKPGSCSRPWIHYAYSYSSWRRGLKKLKKGISSLLLLLLLFTLLTTIVVCIVSIVFTTTRRLPGH